MFKNEYQGGSYVEIFSSQGKDPVAKWKLCGSQSAIFKDFDKEVKSFVFVLEGSSQTNKMQLPKENKQMLGLIQRFLVLQVHIPLGQDFSAELLITDLTNIKRRLYLSTVHKELSATPLHAKIPLLIIKRKVWCNLCIDLVAFTSGIFKGAIFQSLDGIIISANCKLRRIFTMKLQPQDTADEKDVCTPYSSGSEPTDAIPRTCQITTDVHQVTQVLDLEKLHPTEARHERKLLVETDELTNRGQGSARNITQRNQSHIAFGSKVLGPPPSTSRKPSSRSLAETSRSSGRQDRSLLQLPLERGIGSANRGVGRTSPPKLTPSSDQRGKEIVQQRPIQEPYPCGFNPNLQNEPPDADRRRSTMSRVESAGKDQTVVVLVDGSSLGHCGNRDKRPVQIHMPSCERTNRAPALNNSSVQSQSTTLSGDWSYREESELYNSHPDATTTRSLGELRGRTQIEEPNQSVDHLEEEDYVFTYSSVPLTTPCGKSHSFSSDQGSPSLDELQNNTRGAQMEEDFYGSDSSREDSNLFHWTSSPKSQSECTSDSISVERTPRKPKPSPAGESTTANLKDITAGDTLSSKGLSMGFDLTQKNLIPTRSLSPDGSRPDICREHPSLSTSQQGLSVNKQRTSINKKSLKELSKHNKGTTADGPGYDRTHYRSNRMTVSEMQMLASLKRQQNEELEDEGTIHGLSQSQVDHCNVDMSTSSDDTATWNICLPPPVSQGCHYENEMNPLNHSNPRDWLNAFSPPIIPISQEKNKDPLLRNKQFSGSTSNEDDDGLGHEEEEEILTLLYDPCLNCYFDPETGKYYELA